MPGVDGRENRWAEPSPSDFNRWADLVDTGVDPSTAARQLGFRGSAQFGRTNPVRHGQVLEAWREQQRGEDRKTARDTLREIASSPAVEAKDRVRASELLGKSSGYLTDRQQVELTGAEGGPVEVQHKAGLTLADVAKLAAELGPGESAS